MTLRQVLYRKEKNGCMNMACDTGEGLHGAYALRVEFNFRLGLGFKKLGV